jgi:GntR family transcriptional repressor for pyruvate dehydrogenase complex
MDVHHPAVANHQPAYQVVVDHLKRAIQLGRYLPGDQLPPERELAKLMQVSRTTLREASRVLEGEGLIETRRGRQGGVFVLRPANTAAESKELLRAKRREIEEVLDFRLAVESAAAGLAAERRTKDDLSELAALFEEMSGIEEAIKREPDGVAPHRWAAADTNFHLGVAQAARNSFIGRSVVDARAAMFEPLGMVFMRIHPGSNEGHEEILLTIREKDAEGARAAMERHINLTSRTFESYLRRGAR